MYIRSGYLEVAYNKIHNRKNYTNREEGMRIERVESWVTEVTLVTEIYSIKYGLSELEMPPALHYPFSLLIIHVNEL